MTRSSRRSVARVGQTHSPDRKTERTSSLGRLRWLTRRGVLSSLPPAMTPANHKRLIRGGITFASGVVALAVVTGLPRFASFGISLAVLLLAIAIVGLLDAMAAFAPYRDPADVEGETLDGAEAQRTPRSSWHGWLVVLIGAALYLPMLGAGGLWDPWETHYGEVARRMLEQDDWISMWWQNEWFFSKPVLVLWMDALGMAVVGGNPYPDGQLLGAAWGMRLPVAALAVFCMWGVYHFVARRFSLRAGLVAAVALGTMPTFAFLARQTMTDMPYVATMSLAICMIACGLEESDEREIQPRRLRLGPLGEFELSSQQALVIGLVVMVLPFSLYLLSRPMSFVAGTFGQDNLRDVEQIVPVPLGVIGAVALAGLGWLLWTLRAERRVRRLYLLAGYFFIGLAVMAKVLPGLVLPGMVFFFFLLVSGRWRELRRFEIGRGLAVLGVVVLPWYLAVVFRHGGPFIDRIIFHDVVNRAVVGVHGDTGTVEYYLEQLGYGAFPWLALVPLGLFGFDWQRAKISRSPAGRARMLVVIWAFSFFLFFSAVITKFHHYIFPVLVPLAILIGIAFDDLLSGKSRRAGPLLLAGVGLLAIVGWDLLRPPGSGKAGYQRFVDLFTYNYRRVWPEGEQYDYSATLLILVSVVILLALPLLVPPLRRILGWSVVIGALVFTGWLMNVYMPEVGDHWSQVGLIRQYYEQRSGARERLVAYQMNWKGENFYTGNRVQVYVSLDTDGFERWVREHAGERHYFITERSRFEGLRTALNRARSGAGTRMEEIGSPPGPERGDLCNKFRMGVTTL